MARPIAPTPQLNAKTAKQFLIKVEQGLKHPTSAIPTPKIDSAIEMVMSHARRDKQDRNKE